MTRLLRAAECLKLSNLRLNVQISGSLVLCWVHMGQPCISSQISPYCGGHRKVSLFLHVKSPWRWLSRTKHTAEAPLCLLTALQHIDPLPTDMKPYTNITWDYGPDLVRECGALTWLFALAWEHGYALIKQALTLGLKLACNLKSSLINTSWLKIIKELFSQH